MHVIAASHAAAPRIGGNYYLLSLPRIATLLSYVFTVVRATPPIMGLFFTVRIQLTTICDEMEARMKALRRQTFYTFNSDRT